MGRLGLRLFRNRCPGICVLENRKQWGLELERDELK
jgi:hypothetical protein